MKTQQFKMGSLFDGSGGFPLASALCDIEPVWASEVEPFPIKVTRARFPQMKHYGDISQINGADLEPVDLITGGSPCQDMSVAGKRQGMSKKCPKCSYSVVGNKDITHCPDCGTELEYTRSGLFMEQIRIVKEMRKKDELGKLRSGRKNEHIRPRFMLWENVTGAFSSNKGEDFRAVLEETAKVIDESVIIPRPPKGKWKNAGLIVGDGYSIAWRVFDAQYWGVPQRRRRIALVADFGGQCAGEILFKREGLSRNFTESRKAWQGIIGDTTKSIGETGESSDKKYAIKEHITLFQQQKISSRILDMTHANDVIREYKDGICTTLQHRMGTGGNQIPLYLQPINHQREPSICYGIDRASFNQGENALYDISIEEEIMQTLVARGPNAVCHGSKGYRMEAFGQYNDDDTASCIKSRDHKDATDLIVNKDYIIRRLTPLECSRLQGFPDWWCANLQNENPNGHDIAFWREVFETHRKIVTGASKPKTDKQIIKWLREEPTDGAVYKMWGNGIALPCFLYVIEGIKEVLVRTSKVTQQQQHQ